MANELQPSTENGHLMSAATSTAVINNMITPLSTNDCKYPEDRPCEKYLQFMDSSRQERTFMIERLVETYANVIDSIWNVKFQPEQPKTRVIPTKSFCSEILKRSKVTYSTVQLSLFYIFRVKRIIHEKLRHRLQAASSCSNRMDDLICCGRRMFLASLMVASKYLHDKNYHNKAWSKITGLKISEINAAELAFLKLIDYRLYISKPTFDKWYTQIHGHIQKGYNIKSTPSSISPELQQQQNMNDDNESISYIQQQQQHQTLRIVNARSTAPPTPTTTPTNTNSNSTTAIYII